MAPNSSDLESTYNSVKAYVDRFKVGEDYGDVTEEQWNAMQTAETNAKAVLDKAKPTKAEQDAQVTALNNALAVFKAAQKKLDTDKWYFIVSRDKTRVGSIQKNGEGENEGIAHVDNIYATFIYGNAAYAASDNTTNATGAGGNAWGVDNKNALHWGHYNAGTGKGGSNGTSEYEGMADPHTMWRIIPVEGKVNEYYIRNRANGKYIGSYSDRSWQRLSDTPFPFIISSIGSGQFSLRGEGCSYCLQFAGDGFVYTWRYNDLPDSEESFAFEPVPANIDVLSNYIPDNSIQIMSLPYAVSGEVVGLNTDAGLNVYGIKGLQVVGGDSTLLFQKLTEIAAGQPFIVIANDFEHFDVNNITMVPFSVPTIEEFSNENKSENGLVANLEFMTFDKPGMGYFKNSKLVASVSAATLDAHSGYIDIGSVPVFTVVTDADATLKINGIGLKTAVKSIVNSGKVFNIYTIDGRLVKKNATSVEGLSKGIYIIGRKKVAVK